jgi:hypothetical protein
LRSNARGARPSGTSTSPPCPTLLTTFVPQLLAATRRIGDTVGRRCSPVHYRAARDHSAMAYVVLRVVGDRRRGWRSFAHRQLYLLR